MTSKYVVVLRPADEAADIIAAANDKGFNGLAEAVLDIGYLSPVLPPIDEDTPLVFTSANGVRAFCRLNTQRTSPVYAVGRNTADEARQNGFTQIESASGTAQDLVALLTSPAKAGMKTPLYVRARDISQDLVGLCGQKGLAMTEIILYWADPVEKLSLELLKKIDSRDIAAVMAFSARGAKVFAELIEQYGRTPRMKTIKALCIGEGVVNSLSVLPFEAVVVASTPDRYGMIKLLDRLT